MRTLSLENIAQNVTSFLKRELNDNEKNKEGSAQNN